MQVAAAFRGSFSELLADARLARTEGLTVKPPAKGVRRSVLCGGWVALHVFELVVLLVYGAFPKGPVHAFWWLLATLLAGVLYVRVCFSDPGFLSPLTVQRMADDLGLDVTVAGSDATRGLLEDVEAPLPRMQELLPVPEQPDGPAEPVSTGGKGGSGGGASGGRARVAPVADGAAGSSSMHAAAAAGTEGIELTVSSADVGAAAAAADEEDANEEDGGAAGDAAAEERLRRKLAYKPRIRGVVESGSEEVEAELARERQARLGKAAGPPCLEDYFSGFCEAADMHMPIRAKFTKKTGRVIAKFDHYCYLLGNAVGERNHGAFWRFLFVQVFSLWMGKWLLNEAYLDWGRKAVWVVANAPLLLLNLLCWCFGIPLSMLLLTHTFFACTSTTTYEWLKLEKLEYMQGFYEFSFPFSEGLCGNLRHFCCPTGLKLWRRPAPESDWPDTFWRNKYYSCFG